MWDVGPLTTGIRAPAVLAALAYVATDAQAVDHGNIPTSNTYTIAIGAADPNRVVCVAYYEEKGSTISAVTINGVSCTDLFSITNFHFYSAVVASGTTCSFSITSSATLAAVALSVGTTITATPTPTDHNGSAFAFSADPHTSGPITVPANGIGVAYFMGADSSGGKLPLIWSNMTNQTAGAAAEQTANGSFIGVGATTVAGSVNPSVQGTANTASTGNGVIAVAFGP